MATGDILSVEIKPDGWYADITIEGLSTGGTYATRLGFNTNHNPHTSTPLIKFLVTSLSYDDNGNSSTIVRTVYGTKPVRKAYPNDSQYEEATSGSDVVIRVALSDYVFQGDTAPTYTIGAGVYTQGTASHAASGTAINSSAAPYQKVVAQWSWVGYERITSSTFKLRCVAFHRDAQQGRPVRSVIFRATDGTTTVTSNPVLQPSIDATMPDECPVIEYVAELSSSALDQGAVITCNFTAYPWVGDQALDTATGTAAPAPLYGPIELLCDKNNTYGVTCALVDPTGNDAGANTVYDESTFNPATAYKFLTIGKAAAAIAAYNNANHSRNDVGAGKVYLNAGSYNFAGSSNSYGSVPKAWISIEPSSGTSRSAVSISGTSGNANISDRVRIYNCKITSASNSTFLNVRALWFDGCEFDSATTTSLIHPSSGSSCVWVTHNLLTQFRQGFSPFTPSFALYPVLVRGCDIANFKRSILAYCVIGNKRTATYTPDSALIATDLSSMTGTYPDPCIIAFNSFYGFNLTSFDPLSLGASGSRTHGMAFVQNIVEAADNTGTPNLTFCGAGESGTPANTPQDNIIHWHNTMVGGRCGHAYNSAGSTVKHRRYWSVKGLAIDVWGIKSDTFATEDGARIGNWPVLYGVGASGNIDSANGDVGPGAAFPCEVFGLNSIQPSSAQNSAYLNFVDRQSWDGTSAGSGLGDYHADVGSPMIGLPLDWVLPYDLNGDPRYPGDSAGAYTYGTRTFLPSSFIFIG